MPTSQLQSTQTIIFEGGLDLTQLLLTSRVGAATKLINYEVDPNGGYRRINGVRKYIDEEVPGTGRVKGVAVFTSGILACRGEDVYFAEPNAVSWGSSIATRNSAENYCFERFNINGDDSVVMVDGVNEAATWDGSTYTLINGSGAPADPSICTVYKQALFLAGYSSNKAALSFSVQYDLTNFSVAAGAGEIVVGDEIVALKGFRDRLIILCKNSIHQITGDNLFNFVLTPITTNIGCMDGNSVQEINGDLIFLAPDGLRTIAGTDKVGDTELGSISRQIQSILNVIKSSTSITLSSVVIRKKNQYRLFYSTSNAVENGAMGVIASLRRFQDGSIAWEFGQLRGIKPNICDSGYNTTGEEIIAHGGWDGFVYLQDVGNTINGQNVFSQYQTPDLDLGDAAVRKVLHRASIYYSTENVANVSMKILFDRQNSGIFVSPTYILSGIGAAAGSRYGVSRYGVDIYSTETGAIPFNRTPIQGSGFLVSFLFETDDNNAPHTLEGMEIEYKPLGRR